MRFVVDDGGREAAGSHLKGDCVIRAIAVATGRPYREVQDDLCILAERERPRKGRARSNPRRGGTRIGTIRRYMQGIGWEWVPTMFIGSGCKVHLRDGELPGGRLVVNLSRHLCAVIDGAIHDTYNPSRGGTRCVYGYWRART